MQPDSSTILHAGDVQETDDAVVKILGEARRKVLLCGPRLDLPAFQSANTYNALARLIARDLHNRVYILVGDERYFLERNRRMLQMCRRFSSHVRARRMSTEMEAPSDLFVVIDDRAYLHQPHFDTPVAVANFDARGRARQFTQRFEELWAHAESISEISTLGLPSR